MTRHFTDTSPVIMLFFLPIPNICGVSAAAELDDFFILHKSSQRPLYGNLTDVRTFLHDLCFCNFPKRPFDDLANAIRLRQIAGSQILHVGRKFPVDRNDNAQQVPNKWLVVILLFVPPFRTSLQGLVIGLFGRLNQFFNADIFPDDIA